MAVNMNPSEIDSLLSDLLPKLSSSLAKCRVNINSLKNKATYSHNHNHLEVIHKYENRVANIGDTVLELAAYQKAGMVVRLQFITAGIHMGSIVEIANKLKVKLDELIKEVNGFNSEAEAQAEMSMIELLRVKSKVSFADISCIFY
jgi:hypothetical protein